LRIYAEPLIAVRAADAITSHGSKGYSGTTIYTHTASPRTILEALELIEWPRVTAIP
jgi:hypothetical protein